MSSSITKPPFFIVIVTLLVSVIIGLISTWLAPYILNVMLALVEYFHVDSCSGRRCNRMSGMIGLLTPFVIMSPAILLSGLFSLWMKNHIDHTDGMEKWFAYPMVVGLVVGGAVFSLTTMGLDHLTWIAGFIMLTSIAYGFSYAWVGTLKNRKKKNTRR